MAYDFDLIILRRETESIKWNVCDDEELAMWVADMDFRSPQPVIDALQSRVAHGVFGYGFCPHDLRDVIVARLKQRYDWTVSPDALVFLPGVVPGFNVVLHALAEPGDGLLVQTPVYPPILEAAEPAGLAPQYHQLTQGADGRYEVDFDAFADAFTERTRVFLLCNPHNPVGRVFQQDELARMAVHCLERDVIICSDEIHGDLIFSESEHIPIASLAPEIEAQTITLMAPSKTFNIAGLKCAFAVIPNPDLRERFQTWRHHLVGRPNILGYTAALAAYEHGQPWLDAVLAYLEENRDFAFDFVRTELPGVEMTKPEGTYLAWFDCRELELPSSPQEFFREEGRVMFNDGATFGPGGEGFVRLNFGTPRALLREGLMRMRRALEAL